VLISGLTVLLGLLGDRVDRGRLPWLGRLRRPAAQSRIWTEILDRVLARPVAAAGIAASVLVVLAVPVLQLHTATPGASDLPQNTAAPGSGPRHPGPSAPARHDLLAVTWRWREGPEPPTVAADRQTALPTGAERPWALRPERS
jgi:hypothetical protein